MPSHGKSKTLVEGKYPLHAILAAAEKILKKRTEGSIVLDPSAEAGFPKLRGRELVEGQVLGEGFFCFAYEITDIALDEDDGLVHDDDRSSSIEAAPSSAERWNDERDVYDQHVQDRTFMEQHCRRGPGEDCRYALKRLKADTCARAEDYVNGLVDLAIEAKFLAVLRHPNIIKMRAMAHHGPYSTIDPYFIVLDRLYDTLSTRILTWRERRPSRGSIVAGLLLFGAGREARRRFWNERICVALDIASALKYLHEKHIIYRDLKGDNIGFDVRGDVKIFDFGLSKDFDPAKKTDSGMYHLTECTGSPRYMAPEVALGKPYNENVDVYSFSLLLWQILKLATPYNGFSESQLHNGVYKGNVRPKMVLSWPRSIRTMMKFGWGGQFDRPSMAEMVMILRIECGLEDPAEVSQRSKMTHDRHVPSQSFISAINLGYAAHNTAPTLILSNSPAGKRGRRRSPGNEVEDEETAGDAGDDTEAVTLEEDQQLDDYSTAEQSDVPHVSFIAAAELPRLLHAGNYDNHATAADDDDDDRPEHAPQLFPFRASTGYIDI